MKPRIAIPVPNSKRAIYAALALPQYERAIRDAGGEPVIIPLKATSTEIAQAVKGCDGVLLPGSPADVDPEKYGAERHPDTASADSYRDNTDELLLQDAYNMRKPVFGICYGLQSLKCVADGNAGSGAAGGNQARRRKQGRTEHIACNLNRSRSWREYYAKQGYFRRTVNRRFR